MDRNLTKSVSTGQGDSGDTDIIFLQWYQSTTLKVLRLNPMKLNDMVV